MGRTVATAEGSEMANTTGTVGSKYEATRDLRLVEIAKLIRADIKAAVKAGDLPAGKYSVRCRRATSIDIDFAADIDLFNPARLEWDEENPHSPLCLAPLAAFHVYSEEARETIATLERIAGDYNYDHSDSMVDYFNCRFYRSVTPAGEWRTARREAELLRLRARSVSEEMFPPVASQESWLEWLGVPA